MESRVKIINLLIKTHDFTKNDKCVSKNWKGVISEKKNKSISAGLQ